MSNSGNTLRLRPLEYAHITNRNTNTTILVVGPQNRHVSSNESIAAMPTPFVVVPAGSFCVVRNPHERMVNDSTGVEEPVVEEHGQVKVRLGAREMRYHVDPFPLYPDEVLEAVEPLRVLGAMEGLVVEVICSYSTPSRAYREGERYLLRGPATYYPRVEERISELRRATVVDELSALHCRALDNYADAATGLQYHAGEAYLRLHPGAYIPQPWEEVVEAVHPMFLTSEKGIYVEVTSDYTDPRYFAPAGTKRCAGDVFLVTGEECQHFLLHPYDKIVRQVDRIHVSPDEYCVLLTSPDATQDHTQSYAARQVISQQSFFLRPGQSLENGIGPRPAYLLTSEQALLVVAVEDHVDTQTTPGDAAAAGDGDGDSAGGGVHRTRGDCWLIHGPRRLIPTSSIKVLLDPKTGSEVRERIILSEGQGLYVRHTTSGVIRAIFGPTSYMLEAFEEVWEKPLEAHVERHLNNQLSSHYAYTEKAREVGLLRKSDRAIVYHIPYRSVTQLYNYKTEKTRTVFGPSRILLEPDEGFTVVSLSGSPWDPKNPTKCLPKEPHRITSLYLFLGPSNMSDVIRVETRDHAQLSLQLCYDWYFDIESGSAEKAFSVNDFVGDCCSFIASRVRAVVASLPFEEFHKNSARCLKEAVFGVDATTGKPFKELRFPANNLVITSVDTQELEVLDSRTRQGLQKSANMAIEITTHAQEANAQQIASAREQTSRGQLERQRMSDKVANEEKRNELLVVASGGMSIVSAGKSTALAQASSLAANIEGEAVVTVSQIRAEKEDLTHAVMAEMERAKKLLLVERQEKLAEAEHRFEAAMEKIRNDTLTTIIAALGPDTIRHVARAGPELQVKLLKSLGLEGYLVTDGSSPINLFDTAAGLVAPATSVASTNTKV